MNDNLLEIIKELLESYKENVKEAIGGWPSRYNFSSGYGFDLVLCIRNEISWAINVLKGENIDTSFLESEISKIDKKVNSFIDENKEEYFKYLHKDLDARIQRYHNYLSYCIEGKFGGINQYEYENMLDVRDIIEVIIDELGNNNFDISKQKEKLNEIDEKFKDHAKDILLRCGEPSKWWKHGISLFPKNYWWRHLEDFCGIKSPTLEEVYKNRTSISK